jgi:PAS domain S-box-containing protein
MSTPDSKPAQDDHKLVVIITRVTIAIAIIVALSPPLSYFWLAYQGQKNEVVMEARLHAAFITQVIVGNPASWRAEIGDLIGENLTPTSFPETRIINDMQGQLIARSHGEVLSPTVTGVVVLIDANGSSIGHLVVTRSLVPLLYRTFMIVLLSAMLGIAIFITLRVLPLRALKRAFSALYEEKQTLKDSEERLSIIIDKAVDGIVTVDEHGVIESFNPAAVRIFGYSADEIVGKNIDILIPFRSICNEPNGKILTVGQRGVIATHRNRATFPVELSLSEAHLKGEQKFIGVLRDITERKAAEDKLSYLANFDSLTGLPNRSLFRDRLSHAMSRADRSNHLVALMFLDLDRFKTINDSLGHDVGDALLKHVSSLLQNCLRKNDTICRMDNSPLLSEDDNWSRSHAWAVTSLP